VVYVAGDESRKVSYGELVGGRQFNVKVAEKPKGKDPHEYRIVGKPVPRLDIPPKVAGRYRYVADFSVPEMLHARVVRPPLGGAKLLTVDETQALPGLV
jgi:nicotinate dehydrogenase subunit B